MAFNFNYPNGTPADRGWGPGWPNCQTSKTVPLTVQGVSFPGGIRAELQELATLLLEESLRRGYIPGLMNPGCWGGACRATKRSDGSSTNTPSNHSWYTAVDINAPRNVFGAAPGNHEIKQPMADLWRAYGWRWLGPPIRDWMHFDFAGTPADAKAMTEKARRDFGGDEDVKADEIIEGMTAFLQDKEPKKDGIARRTWRSLDKAAKVQAHKHAVPAHSHDDYPPHTHAPHAHDAVVKESK